MDIDYFVSGFVIIIFGMIFVLAGSSKSNCEDQSFHYTNVSEYCGREIINTWKTIDIVLGVCGIVVGLIFLIFGTKIKENKK